MYGIRSMLLRLLYVSLRGIRVLNTGWSLLTVNSYVETQFLTFQYKIVIIECPVNLLCIAIKTVFWQQLNILYGQSLSPFSLDF